MCDCTHYADFNTLSIIANTKKLETRSSQIGNNEYYDIYIHDIF